MGQKSNTQAIVDAVKSYMEGSITKDEFDNVMEANGIVHGGFYADDINAYHPGTFTDAEVDFLHSYFNGVSPLSRNIVEADVDTKISELHAAIIKAIDGDNTELAEVFRKYGIVHGGFYADDINAYHPGTFTDDEVNFLHSYYNPEKSCKK